MSNICRGGRKIISTEKDINPGHDDITDILGGVVDLKTKRSLVEMNAVDIIEIDKGEVFVILKGYGLCPRLFLLAGQAKKKIEKLDWVEEAVVDVVF